MLRHMLSPMLMMLHDGCRQFTVILMFFDAAAAALMLPSSYFHTDGCFRRALPYYDLLPLRYATTI